MRQFEVTTWDSMTGETHTTIVKLAALALDDNPFDIAEQVHRKVCAESGEDADTWTAGSIIVAGDSLHPLHFITTWKSIDGTVSSENARELAVIHAEPGAMQ